MKQFQITLNNKLHILFYEKKNKQKFYLKLILSQYKGIIIYVVTSNLDFL